MKHGEFMIFENKELNKMRIWLYSDDEPPIEDKILHSFNKSSEKYAILTTPGQNCNLQTCQNKQQWLKSNDDKYDNGVQEEY